MKIAYRIVTGLFCSVMIIAAAAEIFFFDVSVEIVVNLGFPMFIAYVLPVTKILGVTAILSKVSKTLKEWAYAGFFFDLSLAALAHYFKGDPKPLPFITTLIILMLISYYLDRKLYE